MLREHGFSITDITVPIGTGWLLLQRLEMYQAMVKENDTQRQLPYAMVRENGFAGLRLLEHLLEKSIDFRDFCCGDSTESVLTSTQFKNAKAAFDAGEEIGQRTLIAFVASRFMRDHNARLVLDDYYRDRREAKAKEAVAAAKTAARKAEAAKGKAERERLAVEASRLKKRKEATRLERSPRCGA